MVTSVKKSDLQTVSDFCKNSLLGTKISCQLSVYGLNRDFFNIWCYSDDNGVSAVISKFEDSVTLICDAPEDISEIRTFLDMLGFSSLCCNEESAELLGFVPDKTKNGYIFCSADETEMSADLTEEYYREAYELICRSIPDSFDNSKNAYLSFLSDFTFRKRRGAARIKGVVIDGKVASCALTSAETDCSAIISGVACNSGLRKKGLGKAAVLTLAKELTEENKDVYVIALNESADGFYEHIGFRRTERISYIERK